MSSPPPVKRQGMDAPSGKVTVSWWAWVGVGVGVLMAVMVPADALKTPPVPRWGWLRICKDTVAEAEDPSFVVVLGRPATVPSRRPSAARRQSRGRPGSPLRPATEPDRRSHRQRHPAASRRQPTHPRPPARSSAPTARHPCRAARRRARQEDRPQADTDMALSEAAARAGPCP